MDRRGRPPLPERSRRKPPRGRVPDRRTTAIHAPARHSRSFRAYSDAKPPVRARAALVTERSQRTRRGGPRKARDATPLRRWAASPSSRRTRLHYNECVQPHKGITVAKSGGTLRGESPLSAFVQDDVVIPRLGRAGVLVRVRSIRGERYAVSS